MTWCSIFFKFVGHGERATPFRSMLFCRRGICGRWPDVGTMMHWRNHRSGGFLGLDRPKIPTSLLVKSQGFHIKSWWFFFCTNFMAKSPKDWHFMGLNHVFHIFSTSNVQFSGEIHPVFAPQWPRSSLPRASGNSSPRKENSEGGEWEFIQRYRGIILYCIIYVWICIYIYDYFHIYVYIYIYGHTHTRAETPPEALKYLHLSTSSASPHRLLHPIDIENKKNNEFGDLPPPNPKVDLLFWGRWFGCFGFLASPPNPK